MSGDRGHYWARKDDGTIDIFGFDHGFHNGPVCKNCGYGYCHHCNDGPQQDCSKPTLEGDAARVDNQKQLGSDA